MTELKQMIPDYGNLTQQLGYINARKDLIDAFNMLGSDLVSYDLRDRICYEMDVLKLRRESDA